MLDFNLGEMGVVALVALLVVGPKELPGLLRTLAGWRRQIGDVAGQFRFGFDQMMREAELEELRRKAMEMPNANPYQPKPDFGDIPDRPPEPQPLSAGDVGEPYVGEPVAAPADVPGSAPTPEVPAPPATAPMSFARIEESSEPTTDKP